MGRVVALVAIVIAVVFGAVLFRAPADAPATDVEVVTPVEEAVPVSISSKMLIAGDIQWGRLFEREAIAREQPDLAFSGLATLEREKYDTWIGNVECAITDVDVPFQDQWSGQTLNCGPEYLPYFADWFDVASLANNHTGDVEGEQGLTTTRTALEDAGVQHFGHYDPSVTEDACEVVSVQAQVMYSDGSERSQALPIAMCGYQGVFSILTDTQLEQIARYSDSFITIVMPHAGTEYQTTSGAIREASYRKMIDYGADIVVGGHPHWVQNTEVYNEKLIMYSLGNFIFDQQANQEVRRGVALDVEVAIPVDETSLAWLAIADECAGFKDDCNSNAEQLVKSNDIDYTFDIITTTTDDLVTRRNDDERDSLIERTNWQATLEQLAE